METRKLGELAVSPIGMGCMGFSHGYGDIPSEEYSIEAIQKAYNFGCTFYDTAEGYGPNLLPENHGHNERIVGKAVRDFRKNIVLATKLHIPTEEAHKDGLYQTIRRHLEGSMERLQTDYVDLYYLHRVNVAFELEDVADVMGRLIKEGLIRGWGLSQVSVELIERGAAETFRNIFYYGKTLGIYNGVWITLVVVCVLMDIVRSNGKLKPGKENK